MMGLRRRKRVPPMPQWHYHTREQIAARLADGGKDSLRELVGAVNACRQEFTAAPPPGLDWLVDIDDAWGRLDGWLD